MSRQLTEADVIALASAVAGEGGGGTGDGDMKKSVYDSDSAVKDAGGIKPFVEANAGDENVQSDWNQSDNSKDDFIKNKPTIPAAQIQSDWNQNDNTKLDYIKNKPEIVGAVQSDWDETDTEDPAFIKNKPTIPPGSTVDSALSSTSENPVQNKVIYAALHNTSHIMGITGVGTLPSFTASGKKLTFNAGTLPTQGSSISVIKEPN